MKQDRKCRHCDEVFLDVEGLVFANHVRWCDKNATNGDKGRASISLAAQKRKLELKGSSQNFTVTCNRCKLEFTVIEHAYMHPERDVYHCSRSCANSRGPRTQAFKDAVSAKLSKPHACVTLTCQYEPCGKQFTVFDYYADQRFCSVGCAQRNRYKNVDQTTFKHYRQLCTFRFSIASFPDEFDGSLVKEHGWYKAANHGNNLNGVSRDHIVSVRFGFDHRIDPNTIAHPANCKLMQHNANISKGVQCGMTMQELLAQIDAWNRKYSS